MSKAIVRAHRWRRSIESGQARSITDLAEQQGVTAACVCRLLPLTCLAPEILEAILDGRQPKGLRLAEMLGIKPLVWDEQRSSGAFLKAQPVASCSQRQSADGYSGSQAVACLCVSLPRVRNLMRWL